MHYLRVFIYYSLVSLLFTNNYVRMIYFIFKFSLWLLHYSLASKRHNLTFLFSIFKWLFMLRRDYIFINMFIFFRPLKFTFKLRIFISVHKVCIRGFGEYSFTANQSELKEDHKFFLFPGIWFTTQIIPQNNKYKPK